MMASQVKVLVKGVTQAIVILIVLAQIAGCVSNPATGQSGLLLVSSKKERRIGEKLHKEILSTETLYADKNWDVYVNLIGQEIAANSDWPDQEFRFHVLQSSDVNAFALPNGDVFITTGMLMHLTKESHLAAVLAHEIAHVTARHAARKLTRNTLLETVKLPLSLAVWATPGLGLVAGKHFDAKLVKTQSVLVTGYGRELELQADTLGAKYLAASGYQPEDMLGVLEILKSHEEYRRDVIEHQAAKEFDLGVSYHASNTDTHPSADQRLQEVLSAAEAYLRSGRVREDRENYLTMVDGLAVSGRQRYALDSDWAEFRGLADGVYTYLPFTFEALDKTALSSDHQLYLPDNYQQASYIGIDHAHKVYKSVDNDWQSTYLNSVIVAHEFPIPERRSAKEFLLEYINERSQDILYIDHSSVESPFGEGYFISAEVSRKFVEVNGRGNDTQAKLLHHYGAIYLNNRVIVLESFGGALGHESPLHSRLFRSVVSNTRDRAEQKLIQPISREQYELVVYQAQPGDTFATLSASVMLENAEAQLRLINGLSPAGEPVLGQSIKIFTKLR